MPYSPHTSPIPTAASTAELEDDGVGVTTTLHHDIIEAHILTRLDGPTLASATNCSTALHHLASQEYLWSRVCHETWPSTRDSRVVSTFPDGGARAFFAQSFPLPQPDSSSTSYFNPSPPSELISAVDIHHRDELIFSKVQETETVTGWFRCSPFRIDMLDPKDVVPTVIKHPDGDDTCMALSEDMKLSWILIDPIGRRAVNLSSHKPVSVQRHWLTGEVHVRFATILAVDHNKQKGPTSGLVQCDILVTFAGSEVGQMQVREVSLEVEDMDGMHLNGKDSLDILQRALEGKRGKGINREIEGRRRYNEFLEMKRARKEKRLKTEWALDTLSVAFGVFISVAFLCLLLCKSKEKS